MGNEESQQGGAPGQQQGAPGTGFGMGMSQTQQPRFGGPPQGVQPPGMRQVAPTGRPNLRPGGPGPPQQQSQGLRGTFLGGGPAPPRGPLQQQQQQMGVPVRPVQVGVQPWAEPPVQQPPHFRGPAPQPQATPQLRPQLQQQQQQQQLQQQQQQQMKAKQQQQMMAEAEIGVDLSNLSEEEKARILSVMARAQDLDQDYERHKRAKEEPSEVRPPLLCPLCQAVDLAIETNKMCGDCGKNFCQKCGTFVPGEGRRSVWVCNTCSNRRKQISASMATQHQDTATYSTAGGQKIAGDPGRKDETMSREYHLHPDSVGDVVSIPSAARDEYFEEDDDDGWGGFGSSSGGRDDDPMNDDGFSDRTSSIRRMLEEEDEDEDEDNYGSDEEDRGGGSLPFYDRSPGEVYTIPEEEEDMTSPSMVTWDGELNPDTASSLLRWRGMGQPFQTPQQQQQAGVVMQAGGQQQMGQQQQQQPSVSLLGMPGTGTSSGSSLMSGSLIPSSAVGRGAGTIPGTVPLTAVSQQQWPGNTQSAMDQQQQWNMQQTPQQQKAMDMVVAQQVQPVQSVQSGGMLMKSSEWSPVTTDLSPILDVSPSLEAAEQELMEKCVQRPSIPRAQSGTISSLLADFNKSVGQETPTIDDGGGHASRNPPVLITTAQQQQQQQQQQQKAQTTLLTGGTEMDQNQNLVQQHQFQLQQQQLMIQQQQQVIQQQQQQLQQQMQQQIQTQQQVVIQDMQQQQVQQQQALTSSVVQQQPGVVMGGTPMQQQQTPSQRKVHRRLPQPTVDQMQAAVALAAQTPRSKSQSPARIGGAVPSFQRPVSPIMATRNTFESSSPASSSLLSASNTTTQLLATTSISPTTRKDGELSLMMTEADGSKKIRRRLPPVPLDQEPTTVPLRRTKDRSRTLSMPLSTSADRGAWTDHHARRMPQRTTSLDDGMSLTKATTSSILDTLGLSSSSTDTYLRMLAARDLSGLFTTTTTTVTTTSTSILDSIPSSIGLSTSLLGRRDLSAPHSLSLYRDGIPSSTSASYLLDDPGPKLPSYIMSLKQQLREELRSVSDHNRRRITDPDLSGLLSHWGDSSTPYDPLRKLGTSSVPSGSRMAASARRNRHRRHASDTKLSMFTRDAFRDDLALDDPLSRYKLYQGGSTMPFKSYEFESIDDHLGPYRGGSLGRTATYPRRSSLSDMRTTDELRDTAVNSLASKDHAAIRRYNRLRRHTDTGLASLSLGGLDPYGLRQHGYRGMMRTAPRSWHPSPYGSEDEDEREEKKAKIKAEIARRRQHLEEQSARIHSSAYKSRGGQGQGYSSPLWYDYGSPISMDSSSQESGQEDFFMPRRDYRNLNYMASTYPMYRNAARYGGGGVSGWPYDPYAYADDLVDPYDMDVYSPLDSESELLAPMPLLPDMPTRSRRLLHDLGSTPLGPRHQSSRSGVSSQPYDEYEGRGGGLDDPHGSRPPPRSSDNHHHSHHHQTSAANKPMRKAQNHQTNQKYDFPVKRILLTRDPKDRSVNEGNGLGMKVVGGREIPGSNGMVGALVEHIYPGGVVETLGEVREGDQVLEWNGTPLTGKTYEEVQRIIASSGDEVEIVIRSNFSMFTSSRSTSHHHNRHHHHEQQNHHHSEPRLSRNGGHHQQSRSGGGGGGGGSSYHQQQQSSYRSSRGYNSRNYDSAEFLRSPTEEGMHGNSNCMDMERCGSASPSRGYRSSPTRQPRMGSPIGKADTTDNKEKYRAEEISGEIQLQVCYDSKASILYVTIVRARNLVTSRDNSGLPDPYVKCYLLPDGRAENERRTRYFSRCSNPEWKQTMVYPQVPQDQLKKKHLEISVWNYDINRPPEFLGEVILDLKDTSVIDEQSRWYKLHPHDPKKYPSHSVNSEGAIKMARLNNPQKTANSLYLDNDDIRKTNNTDKKFLKQLTRKSNVGDGYTRASEQSELAGALSVHGQHHGPPPAAPRVPRRRLHSPLIAPSPIERDGSVIVAIEA